MKQMRRILMGLCCCIFIMHCTVGSAEETPVLEILQDYMFMIENNSSGLVLETMKENKNDGTSIMQGVATGEDTQLFVFFPFGYNVGFIANVSSGLVLECGELSKDSGSPIMQGVATGKETQLFRFEQVGNDEVYQIRNRYSGLVLESQEENPKSETSIMLAPASGKGAQLFTLKKHDSPPVAPEHERLLALYEKSTSFTKQVGLVAGVNRPGEPGFDTVTVRNGDNIAYAVYEPPEDLPDVNIVGGERYHMFMLTQTDDTQAFIVWASSFPDRELQERLSNTATVVTGIGGSNPNTLKKGDVVKIIVGAEEGGLGVTIDAWRSGSIVGTFSFVIK